MGHTRLQQNITRLMVLLLTILMLLPCAPMAYANEATGNCGDNLTWSLNDGTLAISGSGKMTNFPYEELAPWYTYREEIQQVILPDGLESIGDLAFYQCKNLLTVAIPESVTDIGNYAFLDCEKLKLVTLGSGVRSIGVSAFENCYSLKSITLPDSLISIGQKAFYRCESITSIRIPSNVTIIGDKAFGYCKSLVSVDICARIREIPEFLFYCCGQLTTITLPDTVEEIEDLAFSGCEQLQTVYYDGTVQTLESAQETIGKKQQETTAPSTTPTTDANPAVPTEHVSQVQPDSPQIEDQNPIESLVTASRQEETNGTVKQENITAVQGDNASGSLKVEVTKQEDTVEDVDVSITITVENEDAWDEASDIVDELIHRVDTQISPEDKPDQITVEIFVQSTEDVDSGFFEELAGEKVTVIITTKDGFTWKVDCTQLDENTILETLNMRYTLNAASDELCAELGSSVCYNLMFEHSSEGNVEVMIRLGSNWQGSRATLLQNLNGEIESVQTSVVDRDGFAHFYLAAVNSTTEYYIALDLPEESGNALIPEELEEEFYLVDHSTGKQYKITGRKSSWNMGLGKVMAILAVVMVSAIGVIGFVMYFWNKQRLKTGYVPKWDDEDETT